MKILIVKILSNRSFKTLKQLSPLNVTQTNKIEGVPHLLFETVITQNRLFVQN